MGLRVLQEAFEEAPPMADAGIGLNPLKRAAFTHDAIPNASGSQAPSTRPVHPRLFCSFGVGPVCAAHLRMEPDPAATTVPAGGGVGGWLRAEPSSLAGRAGEPAAAAAAAAAGEAGIDARRKPPFLLLRRLAAKALW